ncbi:hypothetical protein [Mycobacterium shigaense]|uniref:hypothetical protein n=1 Tax=Mycobacterium shigaense TaxID=722731 RepID=UPI00358EEC97
MATAGVAVLGCVAALGLSGGTAVAAPGTPDPPSSEGTLYGDPAAAAPFWRYQSYDDDCVEMSVADVVGEITGNQPSERAIVKLAQSTPSAVHPGPIYAKPGKRHHGEGTSFDDGPTLLKLYSIQSVSTDKDSAAQTGVSTGMKALEQDLAHGRKVIAAVNAELIWGDPVEDKDSDGAPQSNHAVVVTGVDTNNGIVHLNDPGSEDGRDEQVPINVFSKSWNTSDDQMTVTN